MSSSVIRDGSVLKTCLLPLVLWRPLEARYRSQVGEVSRG
jgi:hypothetical protein